MKPTLLHKLTRLTRLTAGIAIGLSITACATVPASSGLISKEPIISKTTKSQAALKALAPPKNKVTVAVYEFQDKTGQFKPTDAGQTLSRAVSQGGNEVLIKALQDAGERNWFTIIERSNLNNLLKERQIITEMRSRYLGETQINSKALPPLLFAGVIFEGGIVGYDTNTITGGVAARYLGIGGKTDYRQSVVTVHLRAVSVKTGEVLASVNTEKTIASVGVAANAFRFVTFDNLLEADAGITSNEPGLLALRQAVEKSVYALIMEGTEIGLWEFRDRNAGMALLNKYRAERDGFKPPAQTVALADKPAPKTIVSNKVQSTQTVKQLQTRKVQPVKTAKAKAVPKVAAKKPAPVQKQAVQTPVTKPQRTASLKPVVQKPAVNKKMAGQKPAPKPKSHIASSPVSRSTVTSRSSVKSNPLPKSSVVPSPAPATQIIAKQVENTAKTPTTQAVQSPPHPVKVAMNTSVQTAQPPVKHTAQPVTVIEPQAALPTPHIQNKPVTSAKMAAMELTRFLEIQAKQEINSDALP